MTVQSYQPQINLAPFRLLPNRGGSSVSSLSWPCWGCRSGLVYSDWF
jgi:hypothetical protein